MALTTADPTLPWLQPQPQVVHFDPGPGLSAEQLQAVVQRLAACGDLQAVVLFGSRARGEAKLDSDLDLALITQLAELSPKQRLACWKRYRAAVGALPCGVDLVIQGSAVAARLAQSRWHVMGDVRREGRVLYAAS